MHQKLIRLSKPLAEALRKGAHRKEMTQQQFVIDAVAVALLDLNDQAITALVTSHEAVSNQPEPTGEEPNGQNHE